MGHKLTFKNVNKRLQLNIFDELPIEDNELFNHKFSLLSERAKNVLLSNDLESFNEFIKYLNEFGIGNFKKLRSCGSLTQIELENFAKYFIRDNPNITINEPECENPIQNISFSIRQKKSFKSFFNLLSTRVKNILIDNDYSELSNFHHAFFIQPHKNYYEFRHCGEKAHEELLRFISKVKEIINEPDLIIVTGFFSDFEEYYFSNYKKIEQDIFNYYFGYQLVSEAFDTLDSIGNLNSVTRERVRQISIKLKDKIIKHINEITFEYDYSSYYFQKEDYFYLTNDECIEINSKEKTNFSKSFMNLCFSIVLRKSFYFIEIKKERKITECLFISKSIACDFIKLFEFINGIVNQNLKHNTSIPIDDLIKKFSEKKNEITSHLDTINAIIKTYSELYSDGFKGLRIKNDMVEFIANSKIRLADRLVELLDLYKKPMHYEELFSIMKDHGIQLKSPVSVHATLMRFPDIFGLKGFGIYGLRKWGGYFGTIGDVAEQYLNEMGKPIDRNDLEKFLCHELIISKDSIKTVLFSYENETRFIKLKNFKVGLKAWYEKS